LIVGTLAIAPDGRAAAAAEAVSEDGTVALGSVALASARTFFRASR